MDRKYHYFYKITNKINNHYYYGVHNTDNLNDGYMGSGKRLRYAYKKYGVENFEKDILKFFDTMEEAFEYEAIVVNEVLVNDENCYNIVKGGCDLNTIGMFRAFDKDGNSFFISRDDIRYKNGELFGTTKGTMFVRDSNNVFHRVPKDDERILNGYYTNKGFTVFKDENNNTYYVSVDDQRRINGELFGTLKNKVIVKDKNGNVFAVDKNDERYTNGELKSLWCGRHHSEESKQKIRDKLTPKNSKNPKIWISKDGVFKYVHKTKLNEYLSNGWVLGRIRNKGR